MKVTAFIGSARKKHTYYATEQLLDNLKAFGNIDYELVVLSNYNLLTCKGCKLCMDKGENFCPIKDDRDLLIEKIMQSDGIILASPNYSFNVSGQMKIFLDRLGFLFHRPVFFGKTFTSIVTQGVFRGSEIVKYFDFIGNGLGFNTVKGCCLTTLEPLDDKSKLRNENKIKNLSKNFYLKLVVEKPISPSLLNLMIFRMARTSLKLKLNESYIDYRYFKKMDWFVSEYYYPVKLNIYKNLTGRIFDKIFYLIYK